MSSPVSERKGPSSRDLEFHFIVIVLRRIVSTVSHLFRQLLPPSLFSGCADPSKDQKS